MSLDFDLTAIPDYMNVCYESSTDPYKHEPGDWYEQDDAPGVWVRMRPVTHVLIFATMSLGMPGITEKNVNEFIMRKRLNEAFSGADLSWHETDDDGNVTHHSRTITTDEIRAHVGLRTNVRYEPQARWLKGLAENGLSHVARQNRKPRKAV